MSKSIFFALISLLFVAFGNAQNSGELFTAPSFPGGATALSEFIRTHLVYPDTAVAQRIEGTVAVRFYVDTTGNLLEISIAKNIHPLLDSAALHLVRSFPKWLPSSVQGYKIMQTMILPITFELTPPKDSAPSKKYDMAWHVVFKDGVGIVSKDDKWGLVDTAWRVIVPLIYDNIQPFYEGRAVVAKKKQYGFINLKGEEVTPLIYDVAQAFCEDLAAVNRNGQWEYIDRNGKVVISMQAYSDAGQFIDGLAMVTKNGKFGFIDKKGHPVIPLDYDYAWTFSEGVAAMKKNDKWGFIDKNNKTIIDFQYEEAVYFSEGLAAIKQNGKQGYINHKNQIVIPCIYNAAFSFSKNGQAEVQKDGRYFFINKQGVCVRKCP